MDNTTMLEEMQQDAINSISSCTDLMSLDEIRISVLGKKGKLTATLRSMKRLRAGATSAFWQARQRNQRRCH